MPTTIGPNTIPPHTELPPLVRRAAAALGAGPEELEPVWANEVGGLTYVLPERAFLKHSPVAAGEDLPGEAERMRWARRFVPVPQVLDVIVEDGCELLVTAPLPATGAVADPHWLARPPQAVPAIGRGLRRLHESLPVAECPWDWSVERRKAGLPGAVRDALRAAPPVDAVVCCGDPCAPNFLIAADGSYGGQVDLGRLGIADRWADLAPCLMSLTWNYGPGWDAALLEAYGTAFDPERYAFYSALWDAQE